MDSGQIAVIGAETALGREILDVLSNRGVPRGQIQALADSSALGDTVPYGGSDITLRAYPASEPFEELTILLPHCSVAFFCVPEALATRMVPLALKANCLAIDTSRAYRFDPRARLLVPDHEDESLLLHEGLISVPGSAAMAAGLALEPIHEEAGIGRLRVTSLEAVSGADQEGVLALEREIGDLFNMRECESYTFKRQIAFNIIPQTSTFTKNDRTLDEDDFAREVRLLLEDSSIAVHATCVRVPVFYCHSLSVSLTTKKKLTAKQCRALLASHEDKICVVDNPREEIYPTPLDVGGEQKVFVGRIRDDTTQENTLSLWIVFDNLHGRAYAAVDCALTLIEKGRLGTNPVLLA